MRLLEHVSQLEQMRYIVTGVSVFYRKDALKVQPMELLSLVHTKESQGSIGKCHKAAIIDHELSLEQFQKFESKSEISEQL